MNKETNELGSSTVKHFVYRPEHANLQFSVCDFHSQNCKVACPGLYICYLFHLVKRVSLKSRTVEKIMVLIEF